MNDGSSARRKCRVYVIQHYTTAVRKKMECEDEDEVV